LKRDEEEGGKRKKKDQALLQRGSLTDPEK
jgi:hypothetical protein